MAPLSDERPSAVRQDLLLQGERLLVMGRDSGVEAGPHNLSRPKAPSEIACRNP